MLHEEKFIEAATKALKGAPEAHSKARMKLPGSYMGKSGLVAAGNGRIAFVEENILEPGEVTVLERDEASGAHVDAGVLGETIVLETDGKKIVFEEVEKGLGARLLEAAGMQGSVSKEGTGQTGSNEGKRGSASGEGLGEIVSSKGMASFQIETSSPSEASSAAEKESHKKDSGRSKTGKSGRVPKKMPLIGTKDAWLTFGINTRGFFVLGVNVSGVIAIGVNSIGAIAIGVNTAGGIISIGLNTIAPFVLLGMLTPSVFGFGGGLAAFTEAGNITLHIILSFVFGLITLGVGSFLLKSRDPTEAGEPGYVVRTWQGRGFVLGGLLSLATIPLWLSDPAWPLALKRILGM